MRSGTLLAKESKAAEPWPATPDESGQPTMAHSHHVEDIASASSSTLMLREDLAHGRKWGDVSVVVV